MSDSDIDAATEQIVKRALDRFAEHYRQTLATVDRMFVRLLLGEWIFAIFIALVISPFAWEGKTKSIHFHVWIALLLGGAIVSLPVALGLKRPGWVVTRHMMAVGQMLISALLIHLTGGRIETHFHVFGSLAILAFYLDWKVLVTGTAVVAVDHFVRGLLWPESVYGIVNPEWWRFLEHVFWVLFSVSFLIYSCRRQNREWLKFAEESGLLEAVAEQERRAKG